MTSPDISRGVPRIARTLLPYLVLYILIAVLEVLVIARIRDDSNFISAGRLTDWLTRLSLEFDARIHHSWRLPPTRSCILNSCGVKIISVNQDERLALPWQHRIQNNVDRRSCSLIQNVNLLGINFSETTRLYIDLFRRRSLITLGLFLGVDHIFFSRFQVSAFTVLLALLVLLHSFFLETRLQSEISKRDNHEARSRKIRKILRLCSNSIW